MIICYLSFLLFSIYIAVYMSNIMHTLNDAEAGKCTRPGVVWREVVRDVLKRNLFFLKGEKMKDYVG